MEEGLDREAWLSTSIAFDPPGNTSTSGAAATLAAALDTRLSPVSLK